MFFAQREGLEGNGAEDRGQSILSHQLIRNEKLMKEKTRHFQAPYKKAAKNRFRFMICSFLFQKNIFSGFFLWDANLGVCWVLDLRLQIFGHDLL